jgi:uncharacterized membrane protein
MNSLFITFSSTSLVQFTMLAGAILAAMASGMMYVFSTGTMTGLGDLPEPEAVRAMQAINIAVINPMFLSVFMGTGLFLIILTAINVLTAEGFNPALLASTFVYALGVVAVTVAGNVPLNDKLAFVPPTRIPKGTWDAYARPWLRWNHVRAAAAAVSSGLLILGLMT